MCENRVRHLKKKVSREAQNNLAKNLFMEVFVILEGPCFLEPWRKNGFYEIFFFVFSGSPCVCGEEEELPHHFPLLAQCLLSYCFRGGGEKEKSQ